MNHTNSIFKAGRVTAGTLAIAALLLCLVSLFIGDSLALPWQVIPTYIKSPLFLEYFQVEGQAFGIEAEQVLVWQHYATGDLKYLPWTDHLMVVALFLSICTISIVLTYLSRFWFLLFTGLMLFILMQLNLGELGFLPEYVNYISIFIFGGLSYFFHTVKPNTSLGQRSLVTILVFGALALAIGQFSQIQLPASASIAFGLFTPLLIVAFVLLFVGSDTMYALFQVATKNAPSGKNGLIHFMAIGLVYLTILALLFLEKTGDVSLDLWLIDPYLVLAASLVCGYLALDQKLAIVEDGLPTPLIKHWLYPMLALLSLAVVVYAELSANDSLGEALQMAILATHLVGGAVFYLYAFMNFTPALLTNQAVGNFFQGERAPLLTGRLLYLIGIAGVVFYLNYSPYYQARASRYTALGALGAYIGSDLLASQYYKQAIFYDYYNFKANYAQQRLERRTGNTSELLERLNSARVRDRSTKATVALANHYSRNDQLFNKLITLRESQRPSPQLVNNLGMAHFEFQNYDSASMAFAKSADLEDSPVVAANQVVLLNQLSPASEGVELAGDDIRSDINRLAILNKTAASSIFDLPKSADTLLTQDQLFYLYNSSLDLSANDRNLLLETLEYYTANQINKGLRDFLMLAHAIQAYQAGRVNDAFRDLNELKVLYNNKRGFYSYALGIWSLQQGAYREAVVYLNEALSANYKAESCLQLGQLIENGKVPVVDHPQSWSQSMLDQLAGTTQKEKLLALARRNSFNVPLTLKAVEALKTEGAENGEIYEALREGITINRYSVTLRKAYAFQAIESGLSTFGRQALEAIKGQMEESEYNGLMEEFDRKLDNWRNKLPE